MVSASLAVALSAMATVADLVSGPGDLGVPIVSLLFAPAVCGLCAATQALRLTTAKAEERTERQKVQLMLLTLLSFGIGLCYAVPLAVTLPMLLVEFVATLIGGEER